MSLLKLSFFNIFRHKSRTFLAVLSIAVGLTALIVLLAIVNGIYGDVNKTVSQMQGLLVFNDTSVSPLFDTIDMSYQTKLKISGVKHVIPEVMHLVGTIDNKHLKFQGPNSSIKIIGINPTKLKYTFVGSILPRLKKQNYLSSNSKKRVVISDTIADNFNKTIGSSINIDGKKFVVQDIFESTTNSEENSIYALLNDVRDLYNIKKDQASLFEVIALNPNNTNNIKKKLEFLFPELKIYGQQEMISQVGKIIDELKILILLITIIASFVAALGVINTILMSVLERFKELGTLKAVGWTNSYILMMIILESIFIGLFGTITGITFGLILSYLLNFFIPTIISFNLITNAFIFGILIGTISGLYPAYIAVKLSPIEALREE